MKHSYIAILSRPQGRKDSCPKFQAHTKKSHQLVPALLASSLFYGIAVFATQAALLGPVYPAPGGNSWSPTYNNPQQSAGSTGGVTWSYSGFDLSAFSQLYWGPTSSSAVSSFLSSGGGTMAFSGITGNTASWTGTATYLNSTLTSYITVGTLFQATVSGASWVMAGSVGLDPGIGAVVNDSSGAAYSVNLQFLAGGMPIDQFYTANDHGSPPDSTSFDGGFFYAAPVPEPSAAALLLLPLAAQGIRILRRKRATGRSA